MGVVRSAHGNEWGDFFYCSGSLVEGSPERLMAVYLKRREIPLPRGLVSVARGAQQPLVRLPRPVMYGNAAVARMIAGGARHHSSSTSTWRTATMTTLPRAPQQQSGRQMFALWHHRGPAHHKTQRPPRPPARPPPPPTQPSTHHTDRRPPTPHRLGALWHHRGPARHKTQRPPRPPARPPPPPTQPSTHHTDRRPPTPHQLGAFWHHWGPARHRAPDKNVHPNGRRNNTNRSTMQPQRSGSTGHHLQGGEPAPQILRQQAPDPSNPSAPYTRKRAQAQAPQSTQLHNPRDHPKRPHAAASQQPANQLQHRPTRSPTRTTAHQYGRQRAPHTRRPKALPHRHVPLPRPTPPTPGPSDPSAPCAPTPTNPRGAPVPKLHGHPARRPRGSIRRPRHRPSRRPSSSTTHQPDRQYGQQKRHLAIARPPTRTRIRTRRTPPSRLTPRGQTHQAASYRQGCRVRRAGHRKPGLPRRRQLAARGHWQATWEASPGQHPCRMARPERWHNWQTAQPRRPHRPPSHNGRSPR